MIEFIEREEFIKMKPQEVGMEFQKRIDEYKTEVEKMTVEEAKEAEKQLMPLMDKWDEIVKGISYTLPKEVANPSGAIISRTNVGKYICEILNKVECEFSYTLGYFQLYMWWKKPKATIDYHTLDGTLHVLGSGLKFRGPVQWEEILTINEYFKPMHDEYSIDNMITYFYGLCHNTLLDKMKLEAPIETKEVEAEQGAVHIDEGTSIGDPVA